MTIAGWIVMSASLALVWALVLWCFYRVLTEKPGDGK